MVTLRYISLLAILCVAPPAQAQAPADRPDSVGLVTAARGFLVAFDSLRWEPFAVVWAADAEAFLPDPDSPHILRGRPAVLAYFKDLFDDVRGHASGAAPSLQILPAVRDFRATLIAPTVGLVSFELGGDPAPGRRTLLWTWDPSAKAWRIRHLHASRLSPS